MGAPFGLEAGWSGKAIGVPVFSAGIVYLIALLLSMQMLNPAEALPIDLDSTGISYEAFVVIPLICLVCGVGGAIAVIPVILGLNCMVRLGEGNIGFRHPAMWALAGAIVPAGAIALFGGWEAPNPATIALLMTGAACASLSRRYVRWSCSED